ncbi:hypothetical protein PV703_12065 [Streptomyces sp. ME01-24h]|nr:hypothetical protein [Streptomyces sp. ME01-24h]
MKTTTRIAAAFAGGYLVGRARKAELALAAAMWLSRRTPLSLRQLQQMQQRIRHVPGLTGVGERLRPDRLKTAGDAGETATHAGGRLSGALGKAAGFLGAREAADDNPPTTEKAEKPAARATASHGADDDADGRRAEKPTPRPRRKSATAQTKSGARRTAGTPRAAAGGAAKKTSAPRKRAGGSSRSKGKSASGSEDDG